MAWFFSEQNEINDRHIIFGEDAKHISKVLRMKKGENITLVTPVGMQYECVISKTDAQSVEVEVLSEKKCENEPDIFVTLYQALPKGDKMDYIVQKCVELGISRIVPVVSARCVSRPDEKSLEKKRLRWQKIALQAAMQSKRGIVPEVCDCVPFEKAVDLCSENDSNIIFYEEGGKPVKDILYGSPKALGMFIGSEGGFEKGEVELAEKSGASAATLGKRILRAETAPLAALSVIMYQTGNFD